MLITKRTVILLLLLSCDVHGNKWAYRKIGTLQQSHITNTVVPASTELFCAATCGRKYSCLGFTWKIGEECTLSLLEEDVLYILYQNPVSVNGDEEGFVKVYPDTMKYFCPDEGNYCYAWMGFHSWIDSRDVCASIGGVMPVLHQNGSQEEFISAGSSQNMFTSCPYVWIGLNDLAEDGTNIWEDGTVADDFTRLSYDAAHETQDCWTIGQNPSDSYFYNVWSDYYCDTAYTSICTICQKKMKLIY